MIKSVWGMNSLLLILPLLVRFFFISSANYNDAENNEANTEIASENLD